MKIALFIAASCLLLGLVELLKRKSSLSANITRRITHVGATVIAAASPLFISKTIIVSACLLFAVTVFFFRKTKLLSSVHDIERKSYGDVFLPLGEAITALLFLPNNIPAFQFGVLVMGISDAFAGFVGERYGNKKFHFLGLTKTTEGSIVFFILTLVIFAVFTHSIGLGAIVTAFILTVAECIGIFGSDNLILPILGAYLYYIFV